MKNTYITDIDEHAEAIERLVNQIAKKYSCRWLKDDLRQEALYYLLEKKRVTYNDLKRMLIKYAQKETSYGRQYR